MTTQSINLVQRRAYAKWMDEALVDAAHRMKPVPGYILTPNLIVLKYFDDGWHHDAQWAFNDAFPELSCEQVEELMPQLALEWVAQVAESGSVSFVMPSDGSVWDRIQAVACDELLTRRFIIHDIW